MTKHNSDFYYARTLLSWLFFLTALVCLFKFFIDGMYNFLWIIGAVGLFGIAYIISPPRRKDSYGDAVAETLFDFDVLEIVIRVLIFPIRLIIKSIKYILD